MRLYQPRLACFGLIVVAMCSLARAWAGVESWSLVHPTLESDLRAVVRGDNHWVAVGDSGAIGNSSDGRTWTRRSAGTAENLSAVVFGNGRYLIGGVGGLILSSTDAVSWSVARGADGANSLRAAGAARGNGVFVVVQSDGRVLVSADGTTWTSQVIALPSATGAAMRAVAFGDGTFVAIGSIGYTEPLIYTSVDGSTWTRRAQAFVMDNLGYTGGEGLLGVTFGGGQFVAVGGSNIVITSPDGINWTSRRVPSPQGRSSSHTTVSYGNGTYLIGLYSSGAYLTSSDAITWTVTSSPSNQPTAILGFTAMGFADGAFVGVGTAGAAAIKTATDDWTFTASKLSLGYVGLAYGNGRYLLSGYYSASSSDGVLWSATAGGLNFSRPLFANGKFWTAASLYSGVGVFNSADGRAWTQQGTAAFDIGRMVFARGKYVASSFRAMASSSDGVTWTQHPLAGEKNYFTVVEGNGRFVAGGDVGALATSETGDAWTVRSGPAVSLGLMAFGVGRFVAISANPLRLWSSTDGIAWSALSLTPPTGGFSATSARDLVFAAGRFVATIGADIITSTDGLNWIVYPGALGSGTYPSFQVVYGNGRFLATDGSRVYLSGPDETAIAIVNATHTVLVASGQSATLSVTTTGSNLSYQWYRGVAGDLSAPIAGATAASYTATNLTANASFWVRVSNGSALLDSTTLNVRLTQSPTITQQPGFVEFSRGLNPILAAGTTGVLPPTVQWYRGVSPDVAQPVAGATTASFAATGVNEPMRFWARATNASGSADSAPAVATPWETRTPNAPAEQMIFANGLYVAVAGSIATSPDGVTWTRRHTPAPGYNGVKRIAYGNGRFVAIGNDRQMISTDGITWTTTVRSSVYRSNDWLAFGNGVFLSNIAGSDALMASTDGVTWTTRTLPDVSYFGDVVFAQGRFIALAEKYGTSTPIYTSADGVNWQASVVPWANTSLGSTYRLAVAGSKIFVHHSGQLYSSPDGIAWSGAGSTIVGFTQVAFGNGVYVAGSADYTPTLYRSVDGSNWTSHADPSGQSASCVVFGGGRFLTAGSTGNVHASTDGQAWTPVVAWPGQPVGSIAYGNGRWVATGSPSYYQYSRSAAYYSSDGNKWIAVSGAPEFVGRTIFAKNKFFSAAAEGGRVLVSDDGSAWTKITVPGIAGAFAAIVEAGGRLVAIGSGWTASSADGVTWTGGASNASYVQRAVYGNGIFVSHGSSVPLRSPDGVAWVPAAALPTGYGYPSFNSLAFGAGVFVLVGEYGSVYSSTDGVTWTARVANVGSSTLGGAIDPLVDVLFGDGRFIATSANAYHTSVDGVTWTRSQFSVAPPAGVLGFGAGKVLSAAFPAVMESVTDPAFIGLAQQPSMQAVASGQTATFSIAATSTQTLRYQWQKNGVALSGATNASLVLSAVQPTDAGDYRVQVSNALGGSVLSVAVPLFVDPAAPTFATAPVTTAANTGDGVTLTAAGVGNPLPRYQWLKNGVPIVGATNATLSWPKVSPTDAANYTVSLANIFGTTTSAPAVLTVATLLISSNVTPTVGGAVQLTVDAVAGAAYQWRFKGLPLAGATAATLPLTALSRSQNGFYDVVLTYPTEAVTAFGFALDVAPNPLPNIYVADAAYAPRFEREGQGSILAALRLPDGKFLVGGDFTSLDGLPRSYLARLNADGSLDSGYTPPILTGAVRALAFLPDGKIAFGGDFAFADGRSVGRIARLTADLALDASFSAGTGCNDAVNVIVAQPDGRLMLAGAFGRVNGTFVNCVVRLDATGAVDPTFGSSTSGPSFPSNMAAGRALLPLPDGKWMLGGGRLYENNVSASGFLLRLNADGSRDGTFRISVFDDANGPVFSILRQSDGKIVAAGALNYQNVSSRFVARFSANGEPDTSFTFDQSLVAVGGYVEHLIDAGGGKFLIAGQGVAPTRLTSAGERDTALGALPYSSATLASLAPEADGNVRLWGAFRSADGVARTGFCVLGSTGGFSAPVGPLPWAGASIYGAELAAGGKLLVRGSFTHIDDAPHAGLMRLLANGRPDTSFALGSPLSLANTGRFVLQGDGRILVHDGTKLVRLLPDGALDSSFAPVAYLPAALILDRNGRAVVSNAAAGGVFANTTGLRRFLADGAPDASFSNPVVTGFVGDITTYQDGRFLLWGGFGSLNGSSVTLPACLFLDGTRDSSYGSSSVSYGSALPLATFVNGDAFTYTSGVRLFGLPNTFASISTPFLPAAVLPLPDRRFIVASTPSRENTPASFLRKYSLAGVQDSAFFADGLAVDANVIERMLLQDDGGIVVLGSQLSAFGTPRFGLMRLAPAAAPTITTAPVSVQVAVGGTATFSVVGAGTGPLTYQWYRDGSRIVGATMTSLTLANLTPTDVAKFIVKVTNAFGTATSSAVTFSGPNPAPVITAQPTSLLVTTGHPATFSVAATGVGPLAYQWRRSGYRIPGATAATFTQPHASRTDSGLYDVVVSDGLSVTVSSGARLDVAPSGYGNTLQVDASFAPKFEAAGGFINAIVPTSDGKFIVSGEFSRLNGVERPGLARVNAAFQVDAAFVPPAVFADVASAGFSQINTTRVHAVQPDGKILATHPLPYLGDYPHRNRLVRLLTDGTADPSFTVSSAPENVVRLALQPDGKIIVIGLQISTPLPTGKRYVYRLNTDGSLDATYAPVFLSSSSTPSAPTFVVVQPDGKALFGGGYVTIDGTSTNALVRLTNSGAVDPTFQITGVNSPFVSSAAVLPDGRLIVGGTFNLPSSATARLGRVGVNGAWETMLLSSSDAFDSIAKISLHAGGKIWASFGNSNAAYIWRVSPAGVAEQRIVVNTVNFDWAHAPTDGDRLLATSVDFSAAGTGAVRFAADGTPENVTAQLEAPVGVQATVAAPGGKFLVAGGFTRVNGAPQRRIARLNPDGSLDATFTVGEGFDSSPSYLLSLPDGGVMVSGAFTRFGGIPATSPLRLKSDGSLEVGFAPVKETSASGSLAQLIDGRLLVGGTACFLPDGTRDISFQISPSGVFTAVPLPDGNVIVAVAQPSSSSAIYRLRPNGTTDRVGASGASLRYVGGIAVQPDGKVITGAGVSVVVGSNVVVRPDVRRHQMSDLTRDTGFVPDAIPRAAFSTSLYRGARVIAQEDGRILVNDYYGFVRLKTDGTVDGTFAPPQISSVAASAARGFLDVVVLDDGRLVLADQTLASGGLKRFGLIRLKDEAAAVIAAQPRDLGIYAGQELALSATATGPGALTYQWFKNGNAVFGATGASFIRPSSSLADAGSYAVAVTNANGTVWSSAALVMIAPTVAPMITSQPRAQAAVVGGNVRFTVVATGAPDPAFQWLKNGEVLPFATSDTLVLNSVQTSDVADYSVRVSNLGGQVMSATVHLTILPTGVVASHQQTSVTYSTPGTITVTNTFTYSGASPGLTWQVLLPPGYSIESSGAFGGGVGPVVGATDLAEWNWVTAPLSPVTFAYTLRVPAGEIGAREIAALVTVRPTDDSFAFLAQPDPLPIRHNHSVDSNRDQRLSLTELTRMIELFNTRNGASRTGAYAVATTTTEDGFVADATRAVGASATLATYHSTDADRDGRFSLFELTRVIELYNVRNGTTRTGAYHVQGSTEDGFAPGP